jgi:trimeric autotransporter adhesin
MRKPRIHRLSMTAAIALAVAVATTAPAQTRVPDRRDPLPQPNLPTELQSSLSAALGRDAFSYHAQAGGHGFDAPNLRQKLDIHFNSEGVGVRCGGSRWLITVRGYGYGEEIRRVGPVVPVANRNRIDYRRGIFTEWYINGPVGLEQGFTINEPPNKAKVKGSFLTIALTLSGDLQPVMDQNGDGLSLTGANGKPVLRYTGLRAFDASGKVLRTWLELNDGELLLRTDDAGARYPVVIDPWVQLAQLTASDGAGGDQLGIAVSISGNTVVAGAQSAVVNRNVGQGAAYVFVKPASGWGNMTQTAKLTASNGKAGDGFGGAVYIAGNTIVVGACPQSGVCNGPGKVYVFLKPKSGWKTTSKSKAELTASDGTASDGFSNELALSADGNTVAVGAAGATIGGNVAQGAAYVFVKPASGWKTTTQTAKLYESDGAAADFAGEVSVSGDGSTVFVGAPGVTVGANASQGVAYLFARPARGWKTTSKFTAKLSAKNGAAYDDFGFCQAGSACISSDGSTVLATALQENFSTGTFTGAGKAYIFVKPDSGWKTTSKFDAELTASDGQTGDAFGWSAAIAANTAVVGAVIGNGGTGAAYVFHKPKAGWKTTSKFAAKLTPSDGDIGDAFAFSVSTSGSAVAVGSINDPAGGTNGPGAAYVFGP